MRAWDACEPRPSIADLQALVTQHALGVFWGVVFHMFLWLILIIRLLPMVVCLIFFLFGGLFFFLEQRLWCGFGMILWVAFCSCVWPPINTYLFTWTLCSWAQRRSKNNVSRSHPPSTKPKTPKPRTISRKCPERSLGPPVPDPPQKKQTLQRQEQVDFQIFWRSGSFPPGGFVDGGIPNSACCDFLRRFWCFGLHRWRARSQNNVSKGKNFWELDLEASRLLRRPPPHQTQNQVISSFLCALWPFSFKKNQKIRKNKN